MWVASGKEVVGGLDDLPRKVPGRNVCSCLTPLHNFHLMYALCILKIILERCIRRPVKVGKFGDLYSHLYFGISLFG